MEGSTRNMAELNSGNSSDSSRTSRLLWNASHLLTLGLVNRFYRNYQRYRETTWNCADREELIAICYDLEHKIYAYEGLQVTAVQSEDDASKKQVSTFVLRQQIYELFEHLHHQLLYRDPDAIESIIPLIDEQLSLWQYGEDPIPLTDHNLITTTRTLSHIEILIQDLLE